MGEAGQLEQAFLNIILNAVEAMPEGGTLTISSRPVFLPRSSNRPTYVAVDFTDTGAGMNEEQRRRAFTSILTTTKSKGTGLGLAIVGRVVETHHGRAKIKSRAGQGTTISVLLPIERTPEPHSDKAHQLWTGEG